MVVKRTNKDGDFYIMMGKFFGSRIVEKQTNDRIYDDEGKEWYINLEEDKVIAFVSVSKDVVKNIYSVKEKALKEIFEEIKKEKKIVESIVTKVYKEIYTESGFEVRENEYYRNFITIYSKEEGK